MAPATKPDIYFFVADAYARADFLSKTFGYDNAPFLAALRERGFHVSEGAYSNYDGTTFSLASTFSMDYLDDIQDTSASLRQFTKGAWQRLQECLAGRFFQYQGYEFVAFSTPFSGMQFSFADKQERPTLILSEYHSILMNITPITLLLRKLNVPFQAALHRQRISFVLDRLPQLVRRDKPLFVFGYVCCPHPPFVFRADGSPVDSVRPFTFDDGGDFRETGGSSQEYRDGYIAQLEFLNARLLTMIDGVLANNPGAVIVLAGDHGVRDFRNAGAQPPKRIEGMNILLAARMPEKDAATYFPVNATSVNTFRALLNAYWNAGLPILEPRAFSIKHVGQPPFVDVTNELSSP